MSGLESLAILATACNVMQTISFAHESISTFKRLWREGSADPTLLKVANQMHERNKAFAISTEASVSGQALTTEQATSHAALLEVVHNCSGVAEKLASELAKLSIDDTSQARTKLRVTKTLVKRAWKNKVIDDLEADFCRLQTALNVLLLEKLCNKQDLMELKTQEGFKDLDKLLNDLIIQYTKTSMALERSVQTNTQNVGKRVIKECDTTRQHTTTEFGKIRALIERLTQEFLNTTREIDQQAAQRAKDDQISAISTVECNKLLWSLNFARRAERFNEITEAHAHAYVWLFGDNADPGRHSKSDNIQDRPQHDAVYKALLKGCQINTQNSFTRWLSSDEGLYWISGKAGSGKSTLMKFLLNDQRTKQMLEERTERKIFLLSHSFYLMGSKMQCNVKGLLCTLLYQLLLDHDTWIDELLRRDPSLRNKASDTDWSVRDLKDTFFKTLGVAAASYQFCIFLDGLDEVYRDDEGQFELMEIIETLRNTKSVKLCVSSRPEAEFKEALSSSPSLELHSLTAADIYQSLLKPLTSIARLSLGSDYHAHPTRLYVKSEDLSASQHLALGIVEKSDGVFLWARVVAGSLRRGVTMKDTWSTLEKRLESIPRELDELYRSMWDRLNPDDKILYRAEAALYFDLVLDWEKFCYKDDHMCWNPCHKRTYSPCKFRGNNPKSISVIQLVLAQHNLRLSLPLSVFVSTMDEIWNDCSRLHGRLPAISAGLLECSNSLHETSDTGHEIRNPDQAVHFIHRTAREFFVHNEEGRKILSFDKFTFQQRFGATVRAMFSRQLAFRSHDIEERKQFCLPLSTVNAFSFMRALLKVQSRLGKEMWLKELDACQVLHDSAVMVKSQDYLQRDFLGLAITYLLKDYVVHAFKHSDRWTSAYKSYLLVCGTMLTSAEVAQNYVIFIVESCEEWFENIDYLLLQGCKFERVIHPHLYGLSLEDSRPIKITGLEAFLWSLPHLNRGMDEYFLDQVMKTLLQFHAHGADFMQHIYGFYGRGQILSGWDQFNYDKSSISGFSPRVLIKWPMLGFLARQCDDNKSNTALFHGEKGGLFTGPLIQKMKTTLAAADSDAVSPKIIAVVRMTSELGTDYRWLRTARRVSKEDEKCLIDKINQIPGPWDTVEDEREAGDWDDEELEDRDEDEDWAKDKEDAHYQKWKANSDRWNNAKDKLNQELCQILESILDSSEEQGDITSYLLEEIGFAESWPLILSRELYSMGITWSKEKNSLPVGEVYPPVKFIVS